MARKTLMAVAIAAMFGTGLVNSVAAVAANNGRAIPIGEMEQPHPHGAAFYGQPSDDRHAVWEPVSTHGWPEGSAGNGNPAQAAGDRSAYSKVLVAVLHDLHPTEMLRLIRS
jgi:hypothetical protein